MRASDFKPASTCRASAPSNSHRRAISLMKDTDMARKLFRACLIISAASGLTNSRLLEKWPRSHCNLARAVGKVVAQVSKPAVSPPFGASAGLETRDTAGLETCATSWRTPTMIRSGLRKASSARPSCKFSGEQAKENRGNSALNSLHVPTGICDEINTNEPAGRCARQARNLDKTN